jgi:hypothetical protein
LISVIDNSFPDSFQSRQTKTCSSGAAFLRACGAGAIHQFLIDNDAELNASQSAYSFNGINATCYFNFASV